MADAEAQGQAQAQDQAGQFKTYEDSGGNRVQLDPNATDTQARLASGEIREVDESR